VALAIGPLRANDRADVGRSTFYTHYRDKDELLVRAIHDLLAAVQSDSTPSSARRSEPILGFSLPIFEHVDQHRRAGDAGIGAKDCARPHDHLRAVLAELIAEDVAKGLPGTKQATSQIPRRLLVE
jgi:AcrR family transcriptional regulator